MSRIANEVSIGAYPRQRVFGLFLIGAGITMVLATFAGTSQYINPFVFIIGYMLSNIGIMFNKKVRKKYAVGEATAFQEKASKFSVLFLAIAAPVICMPLNSTGDYRLIWLLLLLAVGIHFIPFTLVHGNYSFVLAIFLIINAGAGLYFSNISIVPFGVMDGIIKVCIGIAAFTLSPKK